MSISLGIIASIIFALGMCLVVVLPRYQWLIAGLVFAVVTPVALSGFLFPSNMIGISDWDYYLSYHHNILKSIKQFHVFPFWNPYTCGGTAGLADPEFSVLSPLFLLELFFGESTGLRLSIIASVIIGSWGVLALGKRLRLSPLATSIAALGIFFGSVNLLENVEGHQNILAVMWLPWVLWAWLSAYQNTASLKKIPSSTYVILSGLFLALMFFHGGIYLLMYTALTFGALILGTRHHTKAFIVSLASGLWAIGFSAVKLIPMFLWLRQFQDTVYASSINTLPYLQRIFFSRIGHTVQEIIPNQGGGWHEYGAYIGYGIAIVAVIGLLGRFKQRIVKVLALNTVIAIVVASSGPLFKPFFDQVSFLPRSNVSRIILFAVIPLSLLAAFGTDYISRTKVKWVGVIIATMIALDLMSLSNTLSEQAFIVPLHIPALSPAPYPLAFTTRDYQVRVDDVDYTRAYSATLAGYGTMNYCSALTPPAAVRTIFDEDDNGIIMVASRDRKTRGSYTLTSWSPNKVTATITANTASVVVLNTNYAQGWQVNGQSAISIDGRVGVNISAGNQEVVFEYRAPGFIIGVLLTSFTIILALLILIYKQYLLFVKK